MEDIVEYFGLGMLEIISAVAMLTLFFAFLTGDGAFPEIVQQYMNGICG